MLSFVGKRGVKGSGAGMLPTEPLASRREVGGVGFSMPALALAVAVFSLPILAGCAAPVENTIPETFLEERARVWPLPPEPARIVYRKAFSTPEDLGIKKGFFRKLVEFVLGPARDRIIKPYGVTVDETGRLLVVDTAFKRIHVFDLEKKKYFKIRKAGRTELDAPIGVASDGAGNIYISDSGVGKVYVFNRKGYFKFEIDGFEKPTGVAVNRTAGQLYVVDTGAHEVKIYDLNGNVLNSFGNRGVEQGMFNFPVDIFIDNTGDVYVTDSMNFRLQIFDKDGVFLTMFGRHGDGTGYMARPKGVAVDPFGHIYMVDALFDTVQVFDRSGNFLLNFGVTGSRPGNFWLPSGMFIDKDARIYVADSYNRRVQVFEYIGDQ